MDFVLVGIAQGLGYATLTIYMTKTQQRSIERASMAKNTANYGNDSIRQLKDEERVRLRPAVIFGSDGLDGCAHAAFEILSNAVDEARQGYGKLITLTAFRDGSIQVEDNGRGCPLDWNPSESALTGNSSFASSTPAANTTTTRVATTTSRSAPTAWAPARPSTPPNTWTSRFGAMATSTLCTLRRVRLSAPRRRHSRLSPATRTAPAPLSSGAPILRSLPRLAFPTIGIARPCAVRRWSTPT